MISEETKAKLKRLAEIHALIERDPEDIEDEYWEEFRTLQSGVMDQSLEVVRLLVRAGILSVSLDLDQGVLRDIGSGTYRCVTFDVRGYCENGGICLDLEPIVTGGIAYTGPPRAFGAVETSGPRDLSLQVPDLRDDEEIRVIECVESKSNKGPRVKVFAIIGGNPANPVITPLAILLGPDDEFFTRFVPAPLPEEN